MNYCCNAMKDELERTCPVHKDDRWDCGDNVVHFNPETRGYGLMIRDGGRSTYVMRFCPWCGKKLASETVEVSASMPLVFNDDAAEEDWTNAQTTQATDDDMNKIAADLRKGLQPNNKENLRKIEAEVRSNLGQLLGVDLGKPGSETTVRTVGYINENGQFIVDKVEPIIPGTGTPGLVGYIDSEGQLIVPCEAVGPPGVPYHPEGHVDGMTCEGDAARRARLKG